MIILFTNARDEKNMKEWVAHHLLLGFDLIYIFDHKSKIPLDGQFLNFNKITQKVIVQRCELDGPIKDILISKAANISQQLNADWMLYIDADEFLVINDDNVKSVQQILQYYNYADSVSCNWLVFGTNFHEKQPEGLIFDNFIRSDEFLNDHLKTFFRPNQFLTPNAHRSDIKNPDKAFHFNGTQLNKVFPVYLENKHYINPIPYEKAKIFIAHYITQSEEFYISRKLKLPRDDWNTFREPGIILNTQKQIINESHTIHEEFNDKINTIVRDKYSENIKKFLNSINIENLYSC
jgi:hypothetical protein